MGRTVSERMRFVELLLPGGRPEGVEPCHTLLFSLLCWLCGQQTVDDIGCDLFLGMEIYND